MQPNSVQKQRPNRKFLYREELDRLIKLDCRANERVALDLLIDTGLRVSELANANVGDLVETDPGLILN